MTGGNATLVWDAERCDWIGSIIDGGEAVARRAKHAMPRMLSQNRLIEVKDGITTVATYAYDYLGRRILKSVPQDASDSNSPITNTYFLYNGWNLIADYTSPIPNSTFIIHNSYTWGLDLSGSMQGAGGVGGLLAVKEASSLFYLTYDGNGNVSEYLDSTGAAVAHYQYDAFGNTTVSTGREKRRLFTPFQHKTPRCRNRPLLLRLQVL